MSLLLHLDITLMDANYTVDSKLGFQSISLEDLPFNEETDMVVKFGEVIIIFHNYMIASYYFV